MKHLCLLSLFVSISLLAVNVYCQESDDESISIFESKEEIDEFIQAIKNLFDDPETKKEFCTNLNFPADKCDEYINLLAERYADLLNNVKISNLERKKREQMENNEEKKIDLEKEVNKKKKSIARNVVLNVDDENDDDDGTDSNGLGSGAVLAALLGTFNNQGPQTQIAVSQGVDVPFLNIVVPTTVLNRNRLFPFGLGTR